MIWTPQDWAEPDDLILRGPAEYDVRHHAAFSKTILHETLHFWQYISLGFLVRLTEENWNRVCIYETTGHIQPPGQIGDEFTRPYKIAPDAQFCARDLLESMTRYWELVIRGPHLVIEEEFKQNKLDDESRKQYLQLKDANALTIDGNARGETLDFLMQSGDDDSYRLPYISYVDSVAPLFQYFFPLVAHFAFQTPRPAYFFRVFTDALRPHALETLFPSMPAGASVFITQPDGSISPSDALWANYFSLRNICQPLVVQETGYGFLTGRQAIASSGVLTYNPMYQWVVERQEEMLFLANLWKLFKNDLQPTATPSEFQNSILLALVNDTNAIASRVAELLGESLPSDEPVPLCPRTNNEMLLDRAFALPGIGKEGGRGVLVGFLAPPCIRFTREEKVWAFNEFCISKLLPKKADKKADRVMKKLLRFMGYKARSEPSVLVRTCLDTTSRWRKFLRAVQGLSF